MRLFRCEEGRERDVVMWVGIMSAWALFVAVGEGWVKMFFMDSYSWKDV